MQFDANHSKLHIVSSDGVLTLLLSLAALGELCGCTVLVPELLPDSGQPADGAASILGQTHQSYEEPR